MYCTNCGTKLNEHAQFCHECGHQIEKKLFSNGLNQEELATTEKAEATHSQADDLMKFVGKNTSYYKRKWDHMAHNNKNTSFNFAAFFFNILWFGYRKMYKPIFIMALLFLFVDILLYLVGYKYNLERSVDPIAQGVGVATAIIVGLYANYLYKKHAVNMVHKISATSNNDEATKMNALKSKGGTSFGGILLSIIILFGVYIIPTLFIPVNLNEVGTVKQTEFIEYPDVTIGTMFNQVFDGVKWAHVESNPDYDIVEFTGSIYESNRKTDVSIKFIIDDSDYIEVYDVVYNGFNLDPDEQDDFIDFIFYEYNNLY